MEIHRDVIPDGGYIPLSSIKTFKIPFIKLLIVRSKYRFRQFEPSPKSQPCLMSPAQMSLGKMMWRSRCEWTWWTGTDRKIQEGLKNAKVED